MAAQSGAQPLQRRQTKQVTRDRVPRAGDEKLERICRGPTRRGPTRVAHVTSEPYRPGLQPEHGLYCSFVHETRAARRPADDSPLDTSRSARIVAHDTPAHSTTDHPGLYRVPANRLSGNQGIETNSPCSRRSPAFLRERPAGKGNYRVDRLGLRSRHAIATLPAGPVALPASMGHDLGIWKAGSGARGRGSVNE